MVRQTNSEVKKTGLMKMKFIASGLFVLVALVFVLASYFAENFSWSGYVIAASEAAMVGALADWFAVTALFKHPLGLPIPHTAIIQKRKDQIGVSLGEFVKDNFLTSEVIKSRIANADIAQRIGIWLADEDHSKLAARQVSVLVSGFGEVLSDETIQNSIDDVIAKRIEALPTAKVLGRFIDIAVEGDYHQELFDSTLKAFSKYLEDNSVVFREKFAEESPWWIPGLVDDRIYNRIYDSVSSFVNEIINDPQHELRLDFDRRVREFAFELENSESMQQKAEGWKNQIMDHPQIIAWINSLWSRIKQSIIKAAKNPDSEFTQQIIKTLTSSGEEILANKDLQRKLNTWIENISVYIAQEFKGEAANIIQSTVQAWDADETAQRLEQQVGKDLQYIRINGTIVGGLAGLLIYATSELIF